jgi:hypothetical protein
LIYDELEYAENLIKNGFVKDMSRKDLTVLAKYYLCKQLDENDTRGLLVKFCRKHHQGFNEIIFAKVIDDSMRDAKKNPLRLPINVFITKSEIEKIREIKNYRYEKILFVMLYCAKYEKEIKKVYGSKGKEIDDKFYVNKLFPAILSMAKVYATIDNQGKIKNELHQKGFFNSTASRFDDEGGFEIFYAEDDTYGKNIFDVIRSPTDIDKHYPPYCEKCGKVIDKTGDRQKFCEGCVVEVNKEQTRNRVKKHRENKM